MLGGLFCRVACRSQDHRRADAPEIWSDAAYHLWTPHLKGVVADDVREIWIDNAHFEGNARITGRFYLKPVRRVDIGPIRIAIQNGHLQTGPTVLIEGLAQSSTELTLAPFDPRTASGSDILRGVGVALDAHFACPDVARIPIPLPNGIAVRGDATVRRLVLDLRDGTLQEGSSIDAILPRTVITGAEYGFTGDLLVTGAVRRTDGQQRFDFRAALAELDVIRRSSRREGDQVLLHIPHGDIALASLRSWARRALLFRPPQRLVALRAPRARERALFQSACAARSAPRAPRSDLCRTLRTPQRARRTADGRS